MLLLRDIPDIPEPLDSRIEYVLDAYQRLALSGNPPALIPQNIDEAISTATSWNAQIIV